MLAVTSYPKRYIDDCRAQMEAQLKAYKAVTSSASKAAVTKFAPLFFNNLTLVLDGYFMHRTRGIEGKDGNPLNEVRMFCTSILQNDGVLAADKTIKYKPEASVLNLEIGDAISLDEQQFRSLFDAYFAEIKKKLT